MPRSRRPRGPRLAVTALVALGLTWMMAGCSFLGSGGVSELDENPRPSYPEPVEGYEPTEDEINQAMPWDCYYDPSMNENWNDDVICRRGTEEFRPILLEGQFVTEADMVAAGEAYEAELNG